MTKVFLVWFALTGWIDVQNLADYTRQMGNIVIMAAITSVLITPFVILFIAVCLAIYHFVDWLLQHV